MSTTHSKIGASSMYRWSACPGSVNLSEGIEQKSSIHAEEGTRAHEIAANMLLYDIFPDDLDAETLEATSLYVETVRADAGSNPIEVEVRFDLSSLYPGLFGTADAVSFDPISKLMRVYDYKHGQGIIVEVENNLQLMYYGLGAMLSIDHPCSEVELIIVQPRASHPDGPIRRWRIKPYDLAEFAEALVDFAEKTEDPNAPLHAGDHCRFCPAAGICPELGDKALAIAKTEFKRTLSYDPEKLSDTLKKLDMLEGYAKSVKAFAYAEAEHGRCPPGWKLVQKRAARHWKDESTLPDDLAKLGIKDIYQEPSFKTPAQMEKGLAQKVGMKLRNHIVSISSGLTLVEESDKRPRALVDPASEFTVIEDKHTEKTVKEIYD
jgi:uncharacterized protein DUF2800